MEDSVRTQEIDSSEKSFSQIFTETLSEGLKSMMGEGASRAIMSNLKLLDALEDPAELHRRLLSALGRRGTLLIELRIINLLCIKLNGAFDIDRCNSRAFLERNWKLARKAGKSSDKQIAQ
jgi:hypothetical protein